MPDDPQPQRKPLQFVDWAELDDDDPMSNTDEYDRPVCDPSDPRARTCCPDCGGELKRDETMAEDGYGWWCPTCEGWVP